MSAAPGETSTGAAAAIELRGLVKDFAVGLRGTKLRAVDHVDLRVPAGEIFGLLGPNGSGKSTTIKLILGLLPPTAGTATIFGIPSGRVEARRDVGYVPETPYFYRHLTGRELVQFYGRLSGLSGRHLAHRIGEVLGLVRLTEVADRRVSTYSKGMLQRIGIAQALVHDPQLLILDEPAAGLDPIGAAELGELVRRLKAARKTVVITSHLLGQIEELCDRIAILDRGRVIVEGRVAELVGDAERQAIVMDALSPPELDELRAWLAARGRSIASIETPRVRLDRVFIGRVGKKP